MTDRITRTVGDVDRILVVGDTAPLENVAVSLTRAFDATTLIRDRSVDDALTRLETADTGVDCLVCGVDADADRNGKRDEPDLAALSRLTTALPETPVLAVFETDSDGDDQPAPADHSGPRDDATRALEAGASDVLRGDESPAVVAARVRNAAGSRSAGRRRTPPTADERRAESLLAHAAAVVCVLEPDGTIDEISPAVERRLGHTPDELEGRPLTRVVHPDDRSALSATIGDVASGRVGSSTDVTIRVRRADGAWIHTAITVVNRLGDPTVDALVATIAAGGKPDADLTAERNLETALERLGRAVVSVGPDDDLRYWNDAATRLFAAPPERGVSLWSILAESLHQDLVERVREARATGESAAVRTTEPTTDGHLEVTVVPGAREDGVDDGDGVTVFADRIEPPADDGDGNGDDAAVSPATSTATDVDREERARLESAVDALEDGILVFEDDRVRYANATVSRLAGGEPIVGRSVADLFDPDLAAAVEDRAGATVVRWMEPLAGELAVGDRRPAVEVFVAPLPAPDRTLCVVRERRRSAESALTMVGRVLEDVRTAPSRPAIRETVLAAALEWTEADAAGWYALEAERLEPLALETAGAHDDVDRRAIEHDDQLGSALADRETGVVTEEPSLVPALTRTGIRAERVLTVSVGGDGVVLVAGPDPVGVDRIERVALSTLARAATLASDRLESKQTLRSCRRGRSRAETAVDREVRLQALERALLSADTLETLERRLCNGLLAVTTDSAGDDGGSFESAWVGRLDERTGTVDPVAWAGSEADDPQVASFPIDADAPDPASRVAAHNGGPLVVDLERVSVERAGPSDPGPNGDSDAGLEGEEASTEVTRWHRRLRERGLRWAVSVPIDYDGVRYGTLTAYAADASAVDEHTRRRLRHLATVAGAVVGPLERTTHADGVTELEVGLRDGDPLAAVAASLDRRLDLRGVVPRPSGGATVYCVIDDVDRATLERVVDRVAGVTSARGLGHEFEDVASNGETTDAGDDSTDPDETDANGGGDPGNGPTSGRRVGVELRLSSRPITEAVAPHGGTVRTVVPEGDRTRVRLEVPAGVSVRSVVERLEREHPSVELLARRERDRPSQFWQPFETRFRTALSDRQRRTLEAAYHGGFFEWPRERTGEDVAAALGVSQPTFSRHLRSAQRNLLALLFEDRRADDRE